MWTEEKEQILKRLNVIAAGVGTTELADGLLSLLMNHYHAESGLVFLIDPANLQLKLLLVQGTIIAHPEFHNIIGIMQKQAQVCSVGKKEYLFNTTDCFRKTNEVDIECYPPHMVSVASLPLISGSQLIGVVQLVNVPHCNDLNIFHFVVDRLSSDIHKSLLINASQQYNERLLSLTQVLGELGTTLDEQELLSLIIRNGRLLTNAEACSLFLYDETSEEYVLYEASNLSEAFDGERLDIRVPRGQGVIGHVIENGESLIVNNVEKDERHYKQSDKKTGFHTHSLLAVPMKSHTINLNSVQEDVMEHIIGGLEAVNKVNDNFTPSDEALLQILANQAATILEIVRAYTSLNEIFLDVISALSAAIDAKDPYTIGHSQRVSEYAALIAQELDLPTFTIQEIRLGGLLHDIGKIGIPDSILQKPGMLTEDEYKIIMDHPSIGGKIMNQVHKLHQIIPGMIEHHERLDGTGYPKGLKEKEISLYGRIIAVADVFDALTSDRPYRKAMPAAQAIIHLQQEEGHHLDERCINGLILAYNKGNLRTPNNIKISG